MWLLTSFLIFLFGFIGQLDGTVDLVAIFRNVRPFGIPNTSVFHQGSFDYSPLKFIKSLNEYGNIVVGSNSIKNYDEDGQVRLYLSLIKLLNSSNNQFITNLRAKCPAEFQALEQVNYKPTLQEKHWIVFDNFLLNLKVIMTIVDLLSQKIIIAPMDLENYQDSSLLDFISSLDIFGIQAQRLSIHSLIPIQPVALRRALVLQNSKLKHLILERIILEKNNEIYINNFFNILNGMLDCDLHEKFIFSDTYNEVVNRRAITADELVSVWFEFFDNVWTYIKAHYIHENDPTVLLKPQCEKGRLNMHRLRNLLVKQSKYNGKNVKQQIIYEAFNFKPTTWNYLHLIRDKLEKISLLTDTATQEAKARAILARAQDNDESVKFGNANELRESLVGPENLFSNVADKIKTRLLYTLEDLQALECTKLKFFMSSLDLFSFKSIASFYKNPGFEIKMIFTDEEHDKAYKKIVFRHVEKDDTNTFKSLEAAKNFLEGISKKSITCPHLSFFIVLKYAGLNQIAMVSNEEILGRIYQFAINYYEFERFDDESSPYKRKRKYWELDLMLSYATAFKTAGNIFQMAIPGKDLGREDFESIDIDKMEAKLSKIHSNISQAKQILLAFVQNEKFSKFYKDCVGQKKIAAINPLNVVNFINSIGSIVDVIDLIEYEDLDEIITGKFPAYFETFSQLDFFEFPCLAEANVTFMVEMKNQLNWGIAAMKKIKKKFALWEKIAKITRPACLFMKRAGKSLGVPKKISTIADDYVHEMLRLMKIFVNFINQETGEMGEQEFVEYLDYNCKIFSSVFLDKIIVMPYFDVNSELELDISTLLLIDENEMENAFNSAATQLGFSLDETIWKLSELTVLTSATTYRIGKKKQVKVVTSYPEAIKQLTIFYQDYLNDMLAVRKNNPSADLFELFDKELDPAELAKVAFSKNFFKVKDKFGAQQLAITWELSFVSKELEDQLSKEGLSLNDGALLEASRDPEFFKASPTLFPKYAQLIKASKPEEFIQILFSKNVDGESLLSQFLTAFKLSLEAAKTVTDEEVIVESLDEEVIIEPLDEVPQDNFSAHDLSVLKEPKIENFTQEPVEKQKPFIVKKKKHLKKKRLPKNKMSLTEKQLEPTAIEEILGNEPPVRYVARKAVRRQETKESNAKYLIILFSIAGTLILLSFAAFRMKMQPSSVETRPEIEIKN